MAQRRKQPLAARAAAGPIWFGARAQFIFGMPGSPILPVDVWLTCSGMLSEPRLKYYEELLSPDERERLKAFRVDQARIQHLVGKALAKTCLAQRVGVRVDEIRFLIDAKGKPHVSDPPSARHLVFNVSHTNGLVACAVADHGEIGIDVERSDAAQDCLALARYALSTEEYHDVAALPEYNAQDRFLTFWTLKEAYAKARGEGFRIGFKSFAFDLTCPSPRLSFSHSDHDLDRWHFITTRLPSGYRLGLAMAPASMASDITFRWSSD